MASPTQTKTAFSYLQVAGMSVELLRDLHHSEKRNETYGRAILHLEKISEPKEPNITYYNRVVFVAQQHRETSEEFEIIVLRARKKFR